MVNLKELVELLQKADEVCSALEKCNMGCHLKAQVRMTLESAKDYKELVEICV